MLKPISLLLAAATAFAPAPLALAQAPKTAPLRAQSAGGAKFFVKYYWTTYPRLKLNIGHLLLFPDGTAFDGLPDKPLSQWSATTLRQTVDKDEVGRWKMAGRKLVLSFPDNDDNRTLTKNARGWADPSGVRMNGPNYNIYFPILPAPRARLLGAWKNRSLTTLGEMGGGTAMVAAGSDGDWVFRADGTFAQNISSFVSGTTANMPEAYKGSSDVYSNSNRQTQAAGHWRIDGPLLSLERGGNRTVHLAFLLPQWGSDKKGTDLMVDDDRWERPAKK